MRCAWLDDLPWYYSCIYTYDTDTVLNLVLEYTSRVYLQGGFATSGYLSDAYYCNFVNIYFQHMIFRADCRESRDTSFWTIFRPWGYFFKKL